MSSKTKKTASRKGLSGTKSKDDKIRKLTEQIKHLRKMARDRGQKKMAGRSKTSKKELEDYDITNNSILSKKLPEEMRWNPLLSINHLTPGNSIHDKLNVMLVSPTAMKDDPEMFWKDNILPCANKMIREITSRRNGLLKKCAMSKLGTLYTTHLFLIYLPILIYYRSDPV